MSDTPAPTATGIHAQQQFAPGTVLAGRFRIEAMLGIGGMGVVYRATDLVLDAPIALKLLRPELASRDDAFERFRQELLMARQVSSPRVVRIHDLIRHEDQWLIGMDYVDGEGLDRKIDREGPLPFDEALKIARQLAEGLAAAHARGVVHRDLKPANVLIDRDGDAYISDFGVARSLVSTGLTQSGAVVGTPDYLSPEQARGDSVDTRSDLYALGLILFEMVTGRMPFSGGTVGEVLAQRMLRSPPPVTRVRPQTPAWITRLIDRLLRPQPAHRLQSADAVIRAIDHREVPRDFRVSRRLWLGVAAVVIAIAAVVGVWSIQRDATPAGVVAIPALHRLLVLPIQAPDMDRAAGDVSAGDEPGPDNADLDNRSITALTALLRNSLSNIPGLAVVDRERTHQALRQLDPTGSAPIDPVAVQRVVGADRALQVVLRRAPDASPANGWQVVAQLHDGNGSSQQASAVGATPRAALAELASQAGFARLLGVDPARTVLALPDDAAALDAYGAALLARQRSEPGEALPLAQEATTAAPGFIAGWLLLADTARAIGEHDFAYAAIEEAQGVAADAPEALQHRLRAELATLEGDAPAAVREWRALLEATPDDTYAALNLARALGNGGDFRAAIDALKSLVARDPNDPRAWYELGKFSILHGDVQRAVDDYLVRALVLNKRSGNRYGEAETVNALGIGYSRLGQIDDAEEQYRKAVDLRRAVGNRRGLATSLRNLANVLSLQGRFDEATALLERARALHAELGDRAGLAAVDNELGLIAEERGDYPAALAAFRSALNTWQQVGDDFGIARTLNDIGFAHYQLGHYDDAQAYWVQAADAYARIGDQTGRIRTAQNLGLLATARGRWDQARQQLEASLATAEQQQMLEEAAVSHRNLAELELFQGHLAAAMAQAGKAETLFAQREDPRGIADAGLLRVQALLAAHADEAARQLLDELSSSIRLASAEQRGIAALLRAQLARRAGDADARSAALAQALAHARASGVQLLQLQVALRNSDQPRPDTQLATRIAELGHMVLRLRWTQAAMRHALEHGQPATATQLYDQALPLLRRGDYVGAFELHALGARAGGRWRQVRGQPRKRALASGTGRVAGADAGASARRFQGGRARRNGARVGMSA